MTTNAETTLRLTAMQETGPKAAAAYADILQANVFISSRGVVHLMEMCEIDEQKRGGEAASTCIGSMMLTKLPQPTLQKYLETAAPPKNP